MGKLWFRKRKNLTNLLKPVLLVQNMFTPKRLGGGGIRGRQKVPEKKGRCKQRFNQGGDGSETNIQRETNGGWGKAGKKGRKIKC